MPDALPAADTPFQSRVVTGSLGAILTGVGMLTVGFMGLVFGLIFIDESATVGAAVALLAAGLLVGGWVVARRSTHPMLLTLQPQALHLEPLERSLRHGVPPNTVLLPEVSSFSYQYSRSRYSSASTLNLVLRLASGHKLRLGSRLGTAYQGPAGSQPLDGLLPWLQQRLPDTTDS